MAVANPYRRCRLVYARDEVAMEERGRDWVERKRGAEHFEIRKPWVPGKNDVVGNRRSWRHEGRKDRELGKLKGIRSSTIRCGILRQREG